MIRQPIITVLGHVDHGKTSVLDFIRGTTLADREAGNITQHIGATEIPLKTIKEVCGDLLKSFKFKFNLPGLLFIDTPGHEAFTNLRKRGGSIADLAVLIIDINQGIQPQTREAINILKTAKVPFIVAANKLDMIAGWKSHSTTFIENLGKQIPTARKNYEKKFYDLLGQLSEEGFNSNIYKDVDDYTKTVAIVPVSAKTGEGISELLAILSGLSQKFFIDKLKIHKSDPARGTILEIKETKGMGTTADIIIYDGSLNKDDTIIIGGINDIVETKIRALLKPRPLSEIRDKKSQFDHIDKVVAAAGVKIMALDLDKAIAGAPFISAGKNVDAAKKKILQEIEEVLIHTEEDGIILKADTLGSLEAASNLFQKEGILIKRADIGDINKRDVTEAAGNLDKDSTQAFVLGFNVKIKQGIEKYAREQGIVIINEPIVYKVQEAYQEAREELKKRLELEDMKGLTWPAKIKILPQYIFRQSNPAIFGAEVIAGKLKQNVNLLTIEGIKVGSIKSIEDQGKKLEELPAGQQAAVSVRGLTLGRQAGGGDELLVDISENDFRRLKSKKDLLKKTEINVLKQLAEIKRRDKETWGL